MYVRVRLEDIYEFGVRINEMTLCKKSKNKKAGYYYQDKYMGQNRQMAISNLMSYTFHSDGKWESLKKDLEKALKDIQAKK